MMRNLDKARAWYEAYLEDEIDDVHSLAALLTEVEDAALERAEDRCLELSMRLADAYARLGAGACADAIAALKSDGGK